MAPLPPTNPTDKKPWYHKGLRFRCSGCGDCCTGAPGYVWINKTDIAAMADILKMTVERFEKKFVRLVGIRKSLIEYANGDCVFFDNEKRTCDVYQARPRQCRTWPFWVSNLKTEAHWDDMAEHCPGANTGPTIKLDEIQARMKVLNV